MNSEQWQSVDKWPGYEVSNHGRVRSVDRTAICGDGVVRRWKGRVLKQTPAKSGYLQVSLSCGPRLRTARVHVLVATAFHGPCPDGMECRHLDGNPANNRADNLEWGTPGENLRDRIRHGTHHEVNKTRCPQNHPYDEQNTYRPPGNPSARLCRACRAERKAA